MYKALAKSRLFLRPNCFFSFPKRRMQKTNVFDLSQNLQSKKQMFLSFPKIYRAKNKCFWLSRKSTERKTNVFGFQEKLPSEKQMFLAFKKTYRVKNKHSKQEIIF